jgi:GGDEF domain-containing protein
MAKVKPIAIELKSGLIIGAIILLTAIVGTISKWNDFYKFFAPEGILLNWRFVIILLIVSVILCWFIINYYWQKEFIEHDKTKKERDNLYDALKLSDNERLTDIVTGIPNSRSLEKDIEETFSRLRPGKKMQFISIDLKDFRKINNKYGYHKTNELLRAIAQSIYRRMRRNEDMYKYSVSGMPNKSFWDGFYRVHSGGDEFAFIIEGDQADALGFSYRLMLQFNDLTRVTPQILGEKVTLSFHCSIVEIDPRDKFDDISQKAADCSKLVKEATADFSLCWHPNSEEVVLSKDVKKKSEYERVRKKFEIFTIEDKEYE